MRHGALVEAALLDQQGASSPRSECMRLAGYKPSGAGTGAYQTQRIPKVKAAIEKELAEKEELVKLRALRWVDELERIALMDPTKLFDANGELLSIGQMPEDARRAIAAIDIEAIYEGGGREKIQTGEVRKFKLHDKKGCLELLLKWAGKLKDKVELQASETLEQLIDAALKLKPKE
jgi:phage terminase small subunit